jgi:ubiquitin C-terminal hydrolase
MNATLQCFSNVERLRKFLLMQYVYQELEKGKETTYVLSFALAEVLKNLWENLTKKYYAPIHFKEVISNMNPLFKGIAANDSKDLILFLLENIHNELNVRKQVVQALNIPEPNQADYNAVYYEFVSNYFNKNNSIISQEFYGTNNAMTTCENCNISLHNVQIFNIFIFPLEEVRKFKNYNMNIVTLMDCFDFYQKIVTYQNYYCNYCQGNFSAFSQTRIVDAPKTIIINLNRGRGKEFNVDIVFEEYLNLKNYAYNKNNSNFYELIGVISHYGTSDMAGHFIAFCKNSNNNKWYKFNDGFVDESSFSEAKDNGMPYVLFYTVVSD